MPLNQLSTFVSQEFLDAAKTLGVTAEMLASLVLYRYARHSDKQINVISSGPLDGQPCATCDLRASCGSRELREAGELLCFDKLPRPSAAHEVQQ